MKYNDYDTELKKPSRGKRTAIVLTVLCLVVSLGVAAGIFLPRFLNPKEDESENATAEEVFKEKPHAKEENAVQWETGYLASLTPQVTFFGEGGEELFSLPRGSQVQYRKAAEDRILVLYDGVTADLTEGDVVTSLSEAVPAHTLYVRTAVNLRSAEGRLQDAFAAKGSSVEVLGCDTVNGAGEAHLYRVRFGETEGYIAPWYLVQTEEEALANYDNGSYAIHQGRENRYGGGDAASLDYYPRTKGAIAGNAMPEEVRALYITAWRVSAVDEYLALAKGSGINAFVVDIADGGAIGYGGEVMKRDCPSAAAAANNTVENYRAAIQKIKDAGYYVIGRITTFNDTYFVKDHPECAIADPTGAPLKLSGAYWPTAFSRKAWQYKVDLAVEAVELMGFQEIQFDYVRFPDRTGSYEKKGNIDFRNAYGETKAQAIQRFLMYATDILHEKGVYVAADVYGESAYTYVTAYGQYWPAISGVVDVISGMPYPDHFAASGSWRPWEHPYETLNKWGKNVMLRQAETANPATVRTWIQAYNAIREPYNTYGAEEISAQIRGLRDAGCTGGVMTWNAGASLDKYNRILPAFAE